MVSEKENYDDKKVEPYHENVGPLVNVRIRVGKWPKWEGHYCMVSGRTI